MTDRYTYTIGGKKYHQRPLVLGQINQLMQLLKDMVIPEDLDVMVIIAALGDRLPKSLAIVLLEGEPASNKNTASYLRDRDIDLVSRELEFSIDPETIVKVVEDFFDCNPIASLLEKLSGATEKIGAKIKTMKASSSKSSASSPEETSPKETASSGASPSESASPI